MSELEVARYQYPGMDNTTRNYRIAGITVQVEADYPIRADTFHAKFADFVADSPDEVNILLRHHFSIPPLDWAKIGKRVYKKPPWEIYANPSGSVYLIPQLNGDKIELFATFNPDYTVGDIYHASADNFNRGGTGSLTFFPTDQIVLAQVLADHRACYFHSSGVILNGKGFLFVGHSGAGKSTTLKMIRHKAQILCDDRNIVRRWSDGFRLHGSWSHGEIPQVSAGEAPLRAILFLEKSKANRATRLEDPAEIVRRLPFFVIKPLVSAQWWHKVLTLIAEIAREVPCYRMEFDKSGAMLDVLEQL